MPMHVHFHTGSTAAQSRTSRVVERGLYVRGFGVLEHVGCARGPLGQRALVSSLSGSFYLTLLSCSPEPVLRTSGEKTVRALRLYPSLWVDWLSPGASRL